MFGHNNQFIEFKFRESTSQKKKFDLVLTIEMNSMHLKEIRGQGNMQAAGSLRSQKKSISLDS